MRFVIRYNIFRLFLTDYYITSNNDGSDRAVLRDIKLFPTGRVRVSFWCFQKKKNVYQLWNLGRIPILNRAGLTRRDTGTLSGGLVSARAAGKTRKYTEMTVRLFSILFFGCYSVRNNIRDECNCYVRRNIYG